MKVMGNRVLVKIKNKDREKETVKEFTREDGTKGHIYIGNDFKMEAVDGGNQRLVQVSKDDDRSSQTFARFGEVMDVSEDVNNGIQVGDIAILDYKVDNDESILIDVQDDHKLVAPNCITKYVEKDVIAYADRRFPRDRILSKAGEIEEVSDIHGWIRNGKLYAICPYVILNFTPVSKEKKTQSGILYDEQIRILETEVVAVSELSKRKYGIMEGAIIKVKESDVFKIDIEDTPYYFCNDTDVMSIAYKEKKAFEQILE